MADTIYTLTTKKMANEKKVDSKVNAKKEKKPFVPFWLKKSPKGGADKAAKGRMKK